MGGRVTLVGGLSSVHDPLCAAALRGLGLRAEALHPRTDAGMRRARGLGNHGQCNPAHYSVGAVLEHMQRSGQSPAAFAERHVWLTVGSCGPCRLAAFGLEYARVLDGAGLGRLPVSVVEQLVFAEAPRRGKDTIDPAHALLLALVAGDVLTALGHRLRPYAVVAREVEALLESSVRDAAEAFEQRSSPVPALRRARLRAERIARDPGRALPRVLLVGEPWTTLADGDPSYDLARRLGAHGAEVEAPTATDWLLYRLWDARTLRRATRLVRAAWRLFARSAGLRAGCTDMEELARLARPHYDPSVRGGSAHLEIGRALRAARDRSAHLVLSLKPFGCLPSSDLSDGVLGVLLRDHPSVRFLALETNGDADATVESRLEMALHAASLAAADELERSCREGGLSPAAARSWLAKRELDFEPAAGARTFACTAAELLHRDLRGRTSARSSASFES